LDEGAEPPAFRHRILWHTNVETWREPAQGEAAYPHCLKPEIEFRFGDLSLEIIPGQDANSSPSRATVWVARPPDWIEGMDSLEAG
jgi:hypothetical protein